MKFSIDNRWRKRVKLATAMLWKENVNAA